MKKQRKRSRLKRTAKSRATIYWLVPAKPEYELFRDLIRILAKQMNAPVFEPHLTLGATEVDSSPGQILRQIQSAPVRLRIREIAHSSKFTKTLFVRFTPAKSVERLSLKLGRKPGSLTDPHLSLLYKKLPAPVRQELAAAIRLPFREVTFNIIAAMSCVSPTETGADVESWRRLAAKSLTGEG